MSSKASRTVYVGNLPADIREREVEDLFKKLVGVMLNGCVTIGFFTAQEKVWRLRIYGPIVQIEVKIPPRPPGYAFVEFEDARDAEGAIHGRDGCDFDGHRLRVELAHGGRGHASSSDRYNSSGGGGAARGVSKHSEYRVFVTGLPSSASWQDLKDHMRRGGEVCFSQVFRDGNGTTGIVDYTNYEDMKYAIKKLDDSEFRNAFSRGYIRVKEYDSKRYSSLSPTRGRGQSYSHSPGRNRSPRSSKPKSGHRSRSPSRSHSPVKSRPRSLSRSQSRSKSPLPSREKPTSLKKRSPSKSPSRSRSNN